MSSNTIQRILFKIVIRFTTGCPEKTASLENKYLLLKNYRAQNRLYINTLGIVLYVQKCVSQNGQNIPKVLIYSLLWAL